MARSTTFSARFRRPVAGADYKALLEQGSGQRMAEDEEPELRAAAVSGRELAISSLPGLNRDS
jgi:hypothetical protein